MTVQLEQFAAALRMLDSEFADYLGQVDAINCFFAYRWFLCLFKRELSSMDDVLRLWTAIFSNFLSERFEIFVGLAIILPHRDEIMANHLQFDQILQKVVALSSTLDVSQLLEDGERLYTEFHRKLTLNQDFVPQTVIDFFDC